MERFDIINKLINYYGYESYLEIGVLKRDSFDVVKCKNKVSIDPNHPATYKMESDAFFEHINEEKFWKEKTKMTWDIIFIDGWHEREQVKRDISNSLNHLNDNGTIVCHDMCPPSEMHLLPRYCHNSWEAFGHFRKTDKNLDMFVVDTDCGCGVIRKGSQALYEGNIESEWEFFDKNKKEILNLISVEEFNERYTK